MHSAEEQSAHATPVAPAMSPLSDVRFSRFAEAEVAKLQFELQIDQAR
jgi:hypothetical protein